MELVEGAVDLLRALRGPHHASGDSWLSAAGDLDPDATLPPRQLDGPDEAPGDLPAPSPLPPERAGRLRELLGQLAEGLAALHASRRLHRDVKPSNVLVTPDDRVVLVDFGLVASLEPDHIAHQRMIAGSVPYMSPEQSLGAELGPASDWYAFGAVLYELLTGRPPFAGARAAVLAAKRGREVVPPAQVVPFVPPDLDRLCVGLLALDPAERPTGAEVLRALGRPVPPVRDDRVELVGRTAQLARLEEAFAALEAGRPSVVHVRGASGMGKSALVATALDRMRQAPGALVLSARCYERDHVPFKAIDPLIDALVPWLEAQPREVRAALAPRHVGPLRRLFPVLGRVAPFAQTAGAGPDPHEDQRRGFLALRELLARVGDRVRLVLHVDDLQWADRDSMVLLRSVLRPPDPPAMLLILARRPEGSPASEAEPAADGPPIEVGPLGDDEAHALLRRLHPGARPDEAATLVRESLGSPFFLTELAHEARQAPGGAPSLGEVVKARVAGLPEGPRRLLQAIALASAPLARGVAAEVAEIRSPTAFTALQAARLVRSEGPGAADPVECSHDRIREAVVADLGEAAPLHLRLAEALERAGGADPDRLCTHFRRGGDLRRALRYAREAAEESTRSLAFDRAAANLRRLLELLGPDSDERGVVLARLGEALTHAGRGAEAADALLAAAPLLRAPSLRLEAACQLVWSGHLARGRSLLIESLEALGVRVPRTPWGMRLLGLWHRLRSRLAPLRFPPRRGERIDEAALQRTRALGDAGLVCLTSDQDLAFVTLARFVTEARGLGDPVQFARAMATESMVSHLEPWGEARGKAAFALGIELARQTGDPLARAWLHQFEGVASVQRGEMDRAGEQFRLALDAYRDTRGSGPFVGWCRMFVVLMSAHWDSWTACAEDFYRLVDDALARDDLALHVHVVLGGFLHPAYFADEPERASAEVERAFSRWQQDRFDLMHFYVHIQRLLNHAYQGRYAEGLALLDRVEADLLGSGALNSGANVAQLAQITASLTAGAVLAGVAAPDRVRRARRLVDAELDRPGWRAAASALPAAALRQALGDRTGALAAVDRGLEGARADRIDNTARLLRLQRLRVLGRGGADPEHAELVEDCRARGLAAPLRFLDMYGPVR